MSSLIIRAESHALSTTTEVRADVARTMAAYRVCSVDVGINTAATAAIVGSTGTVIARKFLTCGRHNDRRDALAEVIASKQSASGTVRRGQRHGVELHRRIAGLSLDAARAIASELAAFAAKHGAKAFVVEDLKGWTAHSTSRLVGWRCCWASSPARIQRQLPAKAPVLLRECRLYSRMFGNTPSHWPKHPSGTLTARLCLRVSRPVQWHLPRCPDYSAQRLVAGAFT